MMSYKRKVAIIDFPYSDLINSKKRPVLVIGEKENDLIICAITSNPDIKGIPVNLEKGELPLKSTIKYWQIHTILKERIRSTIGTVTEKCYKDTVKKINTLL